MLTNIVFEQRCDDKKLSYLQNISK